jgi:2-polyprenyl-3-methyl-5-hydroxy-6-metoxy-1,4-benzoquinol methylase
VRECPLCSREGPVIHDRLQDDHYGVVGTWSLRRCGDCRLLWTDPRPLPEDIGALYVRYFTHLAGSTSPARVLQMQDRMADWILPWTLGYAAVAGGAVRGAVLACVPPIREVAEATTLWIPATASGRLLDVGCGNGAFLRRMRDRGWIVSGIEPDPCAVREARDQNGIEVTEGTIEKLLPTRERFDIITLSHVIEHADDPIGLLSRARSLLSSSGRIVILTPNAEGLGRRLLGRSWRGLEVPRHLQIYSRTALAETARRAGLRVLRLRCPSRSALWMWCESRGGFAAGLRPILEGALFHAVEALLSWVSRDAGEEILMVAASGRSS